MRWISRCLYHLFLWIIIRVHARTIFADFNLSVISKFANAHWKYVKLSSLSALLLPLNKESDFSSCISHSGKIIIFKTFPTHQPFPSQSYIYLSLPHRKPSYRFPSYVFSGEKSYIEKILISLLTCGRKNTWLRRNYKLVSFNHGNVPKF